MRIFTDVKSVKIGSDELHALEARGELDPLLQ
jgi:hypothetical protein